MNLCSIYQIFHSSSGKIVKFSPHDVVIQDLHNFLMIVATRSVDSTCHLYRFDRFESSNDTSSCLVAHVDSLRKLWHECLGHVKISSTYEHTGSCSWASLDFL